MEEGGNLARKIMRTIPTSNSDPDQEQGGLGVWCGVNRQRAERSHKSENQKEKEKTNSTLSATLTQS